LEPWERIWIDADAFADDVHSYINCTDCHGGQAIDDMTIAHEGQVNEVVTDPQAVCGQCHLDVAPMAAESLHNTLRGYDTVLYERSTPENHPALEAMQENHCDSCHADCGDCHVSQPTSVGGGLLEGHVFVETPSMSRNCTACHGSRIKDEYYGAHEGIQSDVHFRARMDCMACHTGDEMHGRDLQDADHRYDGPRTPTCESCHENIMENSDIREHARHEPDTMACQVCHSTSYINCVNCHVEQTEAGLPFFTVEDNFLGFYIGYNAEPSAERPYQYVPVRHVPVHPDSFSFYGDDLLPNFLSRPTWVYTTPHNIQRIAPQAERCDNCHLTDDVFLTEGVVDPAERAQNAAVIVPEAPE
jgi:thiosulfate/3-mercaptopyruvate sulfurtransferase